MAKSKQTAEKVHAQLNLEQAQHGLTKLNKRLQEIENFDPEIASDETGYAQSIIDRVDQTLSELFGPNSIEYDRYKINSIYSGGLLYITTSNQSSRRREAFNSYTKGKQQALHKIKGAIIFLEEKIEDLTRAPNQAAVANNPALPQAAPSKNVFIVHGHDDGSREAVARFIAKLDFNPIILHEQANKGRTIIEKVENYSNVGFAIVLLTPDDVGGKNLESLKPRARQNVILELGFFIGLLGRENVCALKSGDVEIPTDFDGVVYTQYDSNGGWKTALARELDAAGHEIDWNKVMRN